MPQADLITSWDDLRIYLNRRHIAGDLRLGGPIMMQGEDGAIDPACLIETPIEEICSDDELIITPLSTVEA